MIVHSLRLVWRRKRANALLVVEVAISFLVLFAVVTLGVASLDFWRRPVGFAYQDVWSLPVDIGRTADDDWSPEEVTTMATLLRELRSMPEIEQAAAGLSVPYSLATRSGIWGVDGRDVAVQVNEVTDDFAKVLRLDVVRGRWFSAEDDASVSRPVVVDRDLARALYGDEEPIGQRLPFDDEVEHRVVGVVSEFRKDGELSAPGNYMFERYRLDDPKSRPPRNLIVRVRPGVDASFEPTLVSRLTQLAKTWTFELSPLAEMRRTSFRVRLVPLALGGVVAGFLLIMVGLGLVGVLWQSVTRRTAEFGLRRAAGASASDIQRQVILEQLLLTAFGLLPGLAIVLQLPLLGVSFVTAPTVALGAAIAACGMLLLAALAALYPSRLATRVHPAVALRYE